MLLLALPLVVSCDSRKFKLPVRTLTVKTADGRSVNVSAELARTAEERNYGFMNRKNIPDGTGMLFLFEQDQELSFWMKNTPHPLSIAYIDSFGVIQDLYDMKPYDLTSITSTRFVRFALEVPQGWFKANGICVGDSVVLEDGVALKTLL